MLYYCLLSKKGKYIFTDAAREARALGLDWGDFYDPIGNPVRNGYSLYPWAVRQGRGTELLSSFLRAAFFDGINTNTERLEAKLDTGLDVPVSTRASQDSVDALEGKMDVLETKIDDLSDPPEERSIEAKLDRNSPP